MLGNIILTTRRTGTIETVEASVFPEDDGSEGLVLPIRLLTLERAAQQVHTPKIPTSMGPATLLDGLARISTCAEVSDVISASSAGSAILEFCKTGQDIDFDIANINAHLIPEDIVAQLPPPMRVVVDNLVNPTSTGQYL